MTQDVEPRLMASEQKAELYTAYIAVIKENRIKHGISQARLALSAGLSSKYVTLLESGRRIPSLECLIALASRAGVARATTENLMEEVLDHFDWDG